MKLAYISDALDSDLLKEQANDDVTITFHSDTDQLDDSYDLFVLKADAEQCQIWVDMIRSDPSLCLSPVYLDSVYGDVYATDGVFSEDTFVDVIEVIRRIDKIKDEMSPALESWSSRALFYLYARRTATILPVKSFLGRSLYRYPLIESFGAKNDEVFPWVSEMFREKIFIRDHLHDYVFLCASCSSAYLQFYEICPSCTSINIETVDFIHCFQCGCMDIYKRFVKDERLICPKCDTHLRYIGDDYDRPLESGHCLDCNKPYLESSTSVNCLQCGTKHDTGELIKRGIYHYSLSPYGKQIISNFAQNYLIHLSKYDSYVSLNRFIFAFGWWYKLAQDFKDESFGLVTVELPHSQSLNATSSLGERLRAILRKTDIFTCINRNLIVVLLPRADEAHVQDIHAQLENLKKEKVFQTGVEGQDSVSIRSELVTDKIESEEKTILSVLNKLVENHDITA